MADTKPSLAEVQAGIQRAILDGADDPVLSLMPANSRTSRDVLFGVYRHAYAGRLVGILAADYESVKTYVGDDYFDTLARAYIAAHPSHTQNARWVGRHLPEFLASADPYLYNPQLSELAGLERALGSAFDAADAPTATIADLAALAPEDWEHLTFTPHPSATLLNHKTNALAIWSALRSDEMPPDLERLNEPQACLVWRNEATPMVRPASAEEAMMWKEAAAGVPFGRLCELLAIFDDPETAPVRAAQILQAWLNSGVLTRASVDQPAGI